MWFLVVSFYLWHYLHDCVLLKGMWPVCLCYAWLSTDILWSCTWITQRNTSRSIGEWHILFWYYSTKLPFLQMFTVLFYLLLNVFRYGTVVLCW